MGAFAGHVVLADLLKNGDARSKAAIAGRVAAVPAMFLAACASELSGRNTIPSGTA